MKHIFQKAVSVVFCVCLPFSLLAQQTPRLVECEAQIWEFQQKDIEGLMQSGGTGPIDLDTLKVLVKKGKATLLHSPRLTTPSGQEGTIKGVTQWIYPTNAPNDSILPSDKDGNLKPAYMVEPAFATREVGAIMQILPALADDGKAINATVTLTVCTGPGWQKMQVVSQGKNKGEIEMPLFDDVMVSTSMQIPNGGTVLAGGGTALKSRNTVMYVFLSARAAPSEKKP